MKDMDRIIHKRPTIGGQGFWNMKDDVGGKILLLRLLNTLPMKLKLQSTILADGAGHRSDAGS